MKKFLPLLAILFLMSCSLFKSIRPIKTEDIERIYLDFNPSQNINFGQPIIGGVTAQMSNGKEHNITAHKSLTFNSLEVKPLHDGFLVVGKPTSFHHKFLHVNGVFKNSTSEETREFTDSIPINYRGNINIDMSGQDGRRGQDGADGRNSIFSQHGDHGGHGESGESGENAPNLTVNIWKISDTVRAVVTNERTNQRFYYQGIGAEKIAIDASGGRGGHAGDGGNGDHGKKGKTGISINNRPGDGGTGGNGGNGGHGGDGGRVKCIIHPSASFIQTNIEVENGGGRGGVNGNPGKPGMGGQPLANQIAGRNGFAGFRGVNGQSGQSGGEPEIYVQDFDFQQFDE